MSHDRKGQLRPATALMRRHMNRLKLGLVFGGKSPEHDISIRSARNIAAALDPAKYEIILIGISRSGAWVHATEAELREPGTEIGSQGKALALLPGTSSPIAYRDGSHFDCPVVLFPITHGPMGEDGSLQGLFHHLDLPFVGPDTLASAAAMDKDVTKRLLRDADLLLAPWLTFHSYEQHAIDFAAVINQLGLPLFIKPANMGSSVGVSRAANALEFASAVETAFQFDTKILVEQAIVGRELECAVMGNGEIAASSIGEVGMTTDDFYDYESKYESDDAANILIPAPNLDDQTLAKLILVAKSAYQTIGCEGMTRVDMFLTDDGSVYVNELNTLPGFTNISMYPKLWEHAGTGYAELLDELVSLAISRGERDKLLKRGR